VGGGKPVTEDEWLKCAVPQNMLAYLRRTQGSDRKLRLFGSAILHHHSELFSDEGSRRVLDANERFADGLAPWVDLIATISSSERALGWGLRHLVASLATGDPRRLGWAVEEISRRQDREEVNRQARRQYRIIVCSLLREVFGNPFRPMAVDPRWLSWNGATVPRLAQDIYDDRDFDRLSVLADALEEAGCVSSEILAHCRAPGRHVRGCWVVDLLLGKS
jgi:hypothetical protein